VIKVTQKFRMGVVAATGGIMVFYLLDLAAQLVPVHRSILSTG
jgi:uncharacterized YccA/Bax inhibitor family protein